MQISSYRVRVAGTAGPAARAAFAGLRVEVQPSCTAVTGELDQPALHRLLDRIQALGLELIDVHPIHEVPPADPSAGGTGGIGGRSLLYRITVSGHLSRPLRAVFEDLLMQEGPGVTVLAGRLDQAALFGVLNRIRVRCLSLVNVTQASCGPPGPLPAKPPSSATRTDGYLPPSSRTVGMARRPLVIRGRRPFAIEGPSSTDGGTALGRFELRQDVAVSCCGPPAGHRRCRCRRRCRRRWPDRRIRSRATPVSAGPPSPRRPRSRRPSTRR